MAASLPQTRAMMPATDGRPIGDTPHDALLAVGDP